MERPIMSKFPVLPDHALIFTALCLCVPAFGCGGDDADDGAGTEAGTTDATTTDDPSTTEPTTSDPTTVDPTSDTEDDPTDTESDPTDTESDPTEADTEDTEGETEDPECGGFQEQETCDASEGCEWLGSPQQGFCAIEGGGGIDVCEELGMQQCNAAPSCEWTQGEGCGATACEGLAEPLCMLAPDCDWDADDETCMDA
jgi:hypothetical protein